MTLPNSLGTVLSETIATAYRRVQSAISAFQDSRNDVISSCFRLTTLA